MDVLIDADTIRSPELRHEIPAGIIDPFLYGEHDGKRSRSCSALDAPTIALARPDLHEAPSLGRSGDAFLPGDVITIEPFLCRPGFGGVQVEDVLLVTDTGAELISDFTYSL